MPAQPLLGAPPLIDQIITMINKQLDLAVHPLTWLGPWQVRLAQRRPSDRERVDRVRLPPHPPRPALRHRQLRRDPHQLLTQAKQQPLQPRRQKPAVLERPQPRSASSAAAQPTNSPLPTATVRSSSIRPASSTATAVTDCLCTSTPITIIPLASNSRWGRPANRQTSIEAKATLLSGHTRRSRSAAATQRWMV